MKPYAFSAVRWIACIKAGCAYALSVFAIGFALGAIRVLFVVPRLGATLAVLMEVPVMLAVSWNASKRIMKRFDLHAAADASLLSGAFALIVLMLLEMGVAVLVFGETMVEWLTGYGSASGAIGLAGQACFAFFPFLQARRS